jgi:cytochrome c peroxidase
MKIEFIILSFLMIVSLLSCRKDFIHETSQVTPYVFDYPAVLEKNLPPIEILENNPMTVQGVTLGRKLFYETLLSGNNSQSCATCHAPNAGFSDSKQFSIGIDGIAGKRNAMPLFNLGWAKSFFWDGRTFSLEEQALRPVVDPIEMHNTWPKAVAALQATVSYPQLFKEAFGTNQIDSLLVAKALAQFERTLLSANSLYDRDPSGITHGYTQDEQFKFLAGKELFNSDAKGHCSHCHGDDAGTLFTDNKFHNNGLDAEPLDPGLSAITDNPADYGKFKTPSVRNLVFTAPYMHDGRFQTLEEVIEHYSTGILNSPTIDPLIVGADDGGVHLTPTEKDQLLFFLKSLTDSSFITNPAFQNPN